MLFSSRTCWIVNNFVTVRRSFKTGSVVLVSIFATLRFCSVYLECFSKGLHIIRNTFLPSWVIKTMKRAFCRWETFCFYSDPGLLVVALIVRDKWILPTSSLWRAQNRYKEWKSKYMSLSSMHQWRLHLSYFRYCSLCPSEKHFCEWILSDWLFKLCSKHRWYSVRSYFHFSSMRRWSGHFIAFSSTDSLSRRYLKLIMLLIFKNAVVRLSKVTLVQTTPWAGSIRLPMSERTPFSCIRKAQQTSPHPYSKCNPNVKQTFDWHIVNQMSPLSLFIIPDIISFLVSSHLLIILTTWEAFND